MTKVKVKLKNGKGKSNIDKPVVSRRKIHDSSYLFAMFGNSVGIDCNPFLITLAKIGSERNRLMKGREKYYKDKAK
jgi:hypothetical protein